MAGKSGSLTRKRGSKTWQKRQNVADWQNWQTWQTEPWQRQQNYRWPAESWQAPGSIVLWQRRGNRQADNVAAERD